MPDLPPPVTVDRAEEVRTFDLAKVKPAATCGTGAGGQIVVCAQDSKRHRLQPPSQEFKESGPPKAEMKLRGGGTVGITSEAASIGGFNSNRVKVGIKLPL